MEQPGKVHVPATPQDDRTYSTRDAQIEPQLLARRLRPGGPAGTELAVDREWNQVLESARPRVDHPQALSDPHIPRPGGLHGWQRIDRLGVGGRFQSHPRHTRHRALDAIRVGTGPIDTNVPYRAQSRQLAQHPPGTPLGERMQHRAIVGGRIAAVAVHDRLPVTGAAQHRGGVVIAPAERQFDHGSRRARVQER